MAANAAAGPGPCEQPQHLAEDPAAAALDDGDESCGKGCVTSLDTAVERSKSHKLPKILKLPLTIVRDWWFARCLGRDYEVDVPPPIAFPDESNQQALEKEDYIRPINLIAIVEHEDVAVTTEGRSLRHVNAFFDFGFREGEGMRPVVLVNASLLHGVKYKAYPDPKTPPVKLTNPDGTTMKLYGELYGRWGCVGPTKRYAQQRVFLNPRKSVVSKLIVMPEEAPYDVLVSAGTIEAESLDQPVSIVAAGQGGKHDPSPPQVDSDAVKNKEPILDAQKREQLRAQRKKEKHEDAKKHKETKKKVPQTTKTSRSTTRVPAL
ncbi:uncharacterized protein LTHEOB_8512 [Neofusicoccum parvum]|nr:uncharacterized protein LTHEOB_8512 [Neofusicoccum parvum]